MRIFVKEISHIFIHFSDLGLRNFKIGVGASFDTVFTSAAFEECASYEGHPMTGESHRFDCETALSGQYVAIWFDEGTNNRIEICDLEVHAVPC